MEAKAEINLQVVRLIRHGESQANAGQPTDDPGLISLRALGQQQALGIAGSFIEPPDLIIHSPMTRAFLTVKPTIKRFFDAPVVQLEIQEFTYLDPLRCKGTTAAQRIAWVDDYWARGDIEYHDDGGTLLRPGKSLCESFYDFVKRV